MSNNGIYTLQGFKELVGMFPNLKRMSFAGNNIDNVSNLDFLEGLDLTEINLSGNPIWNMDNRNHLLGEIKRRFPSIKTVDAQPLVQVDFPVVKKEVQLPEPNTGGFFPNEGCYNICLAFTTRYFKLFDEDRKGLLNVYHDKCHFSMSIGTNQSYRDSPMTKGDRETLHTFTKSSRNVLRVSDAQQREELLAQDNISALYHLQKIGTTQHNVAGFMVDAHMVNIPPGKQVCILSGCCKPHDD